MRGTEAEVGKISRTRNLKIPAGMIKDLNLSAGNEVVLFSGRDSIIIKPIRRSERRKSMERLFVLGDKIRRKYKLKLSDVDKAIKKVRSEARGA